MTSLNAAAIYVGINMLLLIFLAFRVVSRRQSAKVSIGTGGDTMLELRTRVHGNATEYVPAMLIGLIVAALLEAPVWAIHALGAAFTLGRLLHAFGLGGTIAAARAGGTLLTWISIVVTALAVIYFAVA